jgi:putative ABC transport system ATP-binding protein
MPQRSKRKALTARSLKVAEDRKERKVADLSLLSVPAGVRDLTATSNLPGMSLWTRLRTHFVVESSLRFSYLIALICTSDDSMNKQTGDGPVLWAEKLGRSVPTKVLVANASFEVRKGETLAIVGPSGSGKTSLLRLLNRLDEPTSGTVYVDGVDYRQIAPRDLRRRVGMVMQRPYLFPGTVADNLQFGPRQRGEVLSDERLEHLLAGVGLAGYESRDVANLSGGEAQRVSFARTLANSPEMLLLDEPTSALDEDSKREVETIIQKIGREQGIPGVLVTHDVPQAARLAQRALILEAGRIVRAGAVEEVLRA